MEMSDLDDVASELKKYQQSETELKTTEFLITDNPRTDRLHKRG
jgi:hypothetical protein